MKSPSTGRSSENDRTLHKGQGKKNGALGNKRAHCGISMGMRGTCQTPPCTTGGAKVPSSGALCRGGESLNPEQDHQTHLPHHRPRWVLRPPTNPACGGQPAKADKSYKEPQGIPCLDAFRPSHIHFPDGPAGPGRGRSSSFLLRKHN